MIPVFQTITDHGSGNCFAACLASILELSLDQVPNFRALAGPHGDMAPLIADWLKPRGLAYFPLALWEGQAGWFHLDRVWCICVVPSQKNPGGTHAVIGRWESTSLRIIHDPRADNSPYTVDAVTRVGFLIRSFDDANPTAQESNRRV